MSSDVKIDRERLREAVENVLLGAESHQEAQEAQEVPAPPAFVREMRPETMRDLFESGSIDDALRRIQSRSADADWCIACGASSSKPPDRPREVLDQPLSDEMIDRLAEEMLEAVETQ